jgi:hypothetical protein
VGLSGTVATNGHVTLSGGFDFRLNLPSPLPSIAAHMDVTFDFDGRNVSITGHLTGSFNLSITVLGTVYGLSGNLNISVDLSGSHPSGSGSFTADFYIAGHRVSSPMVTYDFHTDRDGRDHLSLGAPWPFDQIDCTW